MKHSHARHRADKHHSAASRGLISAAAVAAVLVTTAQVSSAASFTSLVKKEPQTYLSGSSTAGSTSRSADATGSVARKDAYSYSATLSSTSTDDGTLTEKLLRGLRKGQQVSPSPSPSPTAAPSPTTEPSPSPTPTTEPSPSPTPTTEPSPSPTPTTTPTEPVLLNATFDNLPTGPISPSNFIAAFPGTKNTATATYDDTSIIKDPRGTGNVIRTKLDANTYHSYPAGNNGINVFIPLSKVLTKGCVSYQIRMAGDFYWSLGGKLPGLLGVAPGTSPSYPTGGNYAGDLGWSGRAMWLGPKAYSWAGPTNMGVSYMYNPLQTSQYGDNVRWNKAFIANAWHSVKACHEMNTVGSADGKLLVWFDGVQVVNNTAYTYRTRNDVGISHLCWSIFRGGNNLNWVSPQTDYVDIDNVLVTGS